MEHRAGARHPARQVRRTMAYAYYTTKPAQFFRDFLPSWMAAKGERAKELGVVEFSLHGEGGGSFWVDFEDGTVSKSGETPDCIVRAAAGDFMALVEGR